MSTPASPSRPRSLWNRVGAWVVIASIAVTITATLIAVRLVGQVGRQPEWWASVETVGADAGVVGRDLENALGTQLHKRRDMVPRHIDGLGMINASADWSFAVRSDQANAWLAERLPGWAAQQLARESGGATGRPDEIAWPEELGEIRVLFDNPHIRIGARIEGSGRGQVLSATLTPELRPDGSLWMTAESVQIGSMEMSAEFVLGRAREHAGEIAPGSFADARVVEEFFGVLLGQLPAARRALITLSDGRRVRLVALRPMEDGRIAMTCRTEHAP